ncbi:MULTISPECIES: PaaX family transcriptional regulator [unclassified Streptomyces]|uniref:PaaX family transcriptional regulator n=1 Tax=unclassified Streptomyces TaxID=2593676 RepID=UPI0022542B54|nr:MULTISPECIES: PaaX family transcriptional regulator C-terminal domain-containing protein [unclassified Streptomyces]MCX5052864.1 PaaX family transcriptional regulator [Streptomyces sp. NBC_00474]MCX5062687.1 PaaX family transcriptional regulator [Streptomyces sp. NBC_00452]MCX5291705.1 PaaX family transcriptional regulator [Streptomyces sp. NBC_00183]
MTGEESLRPQSLLLTFLGDQVLGRDVCVYSGSVIDVFERAGVGEQATRSTLTRMVNRGLLRRQREGRRMYFGLTEHSIAVLRDGEHRVWQTGAVNRHWDGTWTLLGFSLPESWQRQRHDLRSKLTWSGFGPLFSGLWIAPGEIDVSELVSELGLAAHVKVFRAHADAGMDIGAMIEDTWDLSELAAGYEEFVRRWETWESRLPDADDALALRLRLQAEWLRIIRRDPRLPVKHLPDDWPAERAEKTFRAVHERLTPLAREASERLLDLVPVRPDQA